MNRTSGHTFVQHKLSRMALVPERPWRALVIFLSFAACTRPTGWLGAPYSPVEDPEVQRVCDVPIPFSSAAQVVRTPELRLYWASAHRGDRQVAADNSLTAIRAAAMAGVPLIEVDVRFTKEGLAFLFHDRTLRKDSVLAPKELYGKRAAEISNLELQQLRIRSEEPTPLPTLRAALREVQSSRSILQLDIKSDNLHDVDNVVELLRLLGQSEQAVIHCDSADMLDYVRSHFPEILTLARAYNEPEIRTLMDLKPNILQIDAALATPSRLQDISRHGVRVLVKSLSPLSDSEVLWRSLYDAGVEIILTDFPSKLQSFAIATYCRN